MAWLWRKNGQRRLEREEKIRAFDAAKARYNRLAMFSKLKYSINGMSPNKINCNKMSVQEIDDLYRGKGRWMKN